MYFPSSIVKAPVKSRRAASLGKPGAFDLKVLGLKQSLQKRWEYRAPCPWEPASRKGLLASLILHPYRRAGKVLFLSFPAYLLRSSVTSNPARSPSFVWGSQASNAIGEAFQ